MSSQMATPLRHALVHRVVRKRALAAHIALVTWLADVVAAVASGQLVLQVGPAHAHARGSLWYAPAHSTSTLALTRTRPNSPSATACPPGSCLWYR